jgi:hypothetical protein
MGISGIERVVYPLKILHFLHFVNFYNYNEPTNMKGRGDMEPIEVIEHKKGFTVEIHWDQEPESPREWDNLGTMVCFHQRYNLGNKHDWPMNREGYQAFMEFLRKNNKTIIALPLYLYDHSGLRMKVGSFAGLLPQGHAEFDTMKVGHIFVEKKKVLKEYGKWTKQNRDKVIKVLESEVETYDRYLSGSVYGYLVKDADGEIQDSCWGFYGMDEVIIEAKAAAEAIYRRSMIQFELPFMEQTKEGENHVELT